MNNSSGVNDVIRTPSERGASSGGANLAGGCAVQAAQNGSARLRPQRTSHVPPLVFLFLFCQKRSLNNVTARFFKCRLICRMNSDVLFWKAVIKILNVFVTSHSRKYRTWGRKSVTPVTFVSTLKSVLSGILYK